MDLIGEERGRLTRAAAWLQATRAELVGLTVLLLGAVVLTLVLWLPVAGRGEAGGSRDGTGGAGRAVDLEDLDRHLDDDGAWVAGDPQRDPAHDQQPSGPLTIHVSGAVGQPGLVVVDAGARIGDAVDAAGSALPDAALEHVNLAQRLEDGQHVHVPLDGEQPRTPSDPAPEGSGSGDAPLDLNRADATVLETLPGIGPARAQAIVEHRHAHGPFAEPGDLRAVSGIGEATFQRIADLVTVR